ncbi:hypothetical protein [Stenotrophomonas sp. RG-453]|uniref:hypothetical protein n=1 Tax=Stenotrophomonas sp. RG-453 TaxID=2957502 RepID=UPI0029C9F681|nr:hypothetical protein [Stenotrophomonas sp. RG-453]MDX5515117.1 hypothetical protein [Stenotrophomonas sp. RG-453]
MSRRGTQMDASVARKTDAEIAKLIAETAKINAEARWYPMLVCSGIFAAAIGLAKYFF